MPGKYYRHITGRHSRYHHLLLDEQAEQILPCSTTWPNERGRSALPRTHHRSGEGTRAPRLAEGRSAYESGAIRRRHPGKTKTVLVVRE
jgi:hypothetical protein